MRKWRAQGIGIAATAVALALVLAGNSFGSAGKHSRSSGPITITFWQQKFEDYQQAWFTKYVKAFNKSQSKYKVNYYVVPGDAWAQKLKAAQAAGTQPDIATTNYGAIAAGVADGEFTSLDGLLPASAFKDIKDNVKGFVTIKGKHYAYPMLVEPSTVLYYRKDLVRAAGLDPNKPPTTWAQLLVWAKKLTTDKVKGMTIASVAGDLGWSSWGLQYNACGHLPISPDWSQAWANDPCLPKLLNFYKALYQGGLIPQQPKVGYADATPYGNGEVAMMACGSWAIGQLKQYFPKMIAKTAVAPFPSWDGKATRTTATLGGWTLTLDSKSKNKQAAAAFINYLLAGNPQIMASFFKASGFSKYTVRKSVDAVLAGDKAASSDPFMKIISTKIVPFGKHEPGYPWDISFAMGTAIESAMKNTASVTDALKTAQSSIDRTIKTQGLAGTGNGN
jgi:multiple sugar transport system substrate-binding protein